MRVRELLQRVPVDVNATERALGYRLDQHHVGVVAWVDEPSPVDALERIRRLLGALGQTMGSTTPSLVIPVDEGTAWAWIPSKQSLADTDELEAATEGEPTVFLAVGEPAKGSTGFVAATIKR